VEQDVRSRSEYRLLHREEEKFAVVSARARARKRRSDDAARRMRPAKSTGRIASSDFDLFRSLARSWRASSPSAIKP